MKDNDICLRIADKASAERFAEGLQNTRQLLESIGILAEYFSFEEIHSNAQYSTHVFYSAFNLIEFTAKELKSQLDGYTWSICNDSGISTIYA
jgi:hypothetical protein